MKYLYTDINELPVTITLSLHDIDRLRRCIEGFEPSENVWFFKRFKETMRKCQEEAVNAMASECRAMKAQFDTEDQVNEDQIL